MTALADQGIASGQRQDVRGLYTEATSPECDLAFGWYVSALHAEISAADGCDDLDTGVREIGEWAVAERARFLTLLEDTSDGTAARLVRRAVLACAPLALHTGAWLQWMTEPGNCDNPVMLRVLSLYASDAGVGNPRDSRGAHYLALLRELRLAEFAVPAARLALDERVQPRDLHVPAVMLAMSRSPEEFRAEILGADLCLRVIGLLPALALVRDQNPNVAEWQVLDPGAERLLAGEQDVEQSRKAVDEFVESGPAERVLAGLRWSFTALRRWSDALFADLAAAREPAFEMAELLRQRAREGAVYHQNYQLDGCPLNEWFRDAKKDATELVAALAKSKLVRPGRADASPLVNGLIMERGPMFRVFGPDDLAVLRRWIDSLPQQGGTTAAPEEDRSPALFAVRAPVRHDVRPSGMREAFHRLQGRADTPELRRYAKDYVEGWLARSRHDLENSSPRLPAHWPSEGLRPWLQEEHDRHADEFVAADQPVVGRDELIDSTVQLAPLTLIDGAWLQGFTDYEHASSEHGYFLFETYWDELGNGQPSLNHPLIYREVLAEMGVDLPPTRSAEFARWPGFRDESFALPVFWLSIGRFPGTYLPELLGLNLAMELSGVGGGYRRARIALRQHGFSTRFVDIHNTIDNVATGHSAWAAAAVDGYVSSVLLNQGADAQSQVWKRIRTGFRSLNPPTGFLARRAAQRAVRSRRDR